MALPTHRHLPGALLLPARLSRDGNVYADSMER